MSCICADPVLAERAGHVNAQRALLFAVRSDWKSAEEYVLRASPRDEKGKTANPHKVLNYSVALKSAAACNNFRALIRIKLAWDATGEFPNEDYSLFERPSSERFDPAFVAVAGKGDTEMAQLLISWGARDFNNALMEAAKNGHSQTMAKIHAEKELVEGKRDSSPYRLSFNDEGIADRILTAAAGRGHVGPMRLAIYWGARDYETALDRAARHGHLAAAREARTHGARNVDGALKGAAQGGHLELMAEVKRWGATDYNEALEEAAASGECHAMALLRDWGATAYDVALTVAASYNHRAAVDLAKAWGATDYNQMLAGAAAGGNLELMVLAKEWGATNYQPAFLQAARNNKRRAMCLVKTWGAADYQQAFEDAAFYGAIGAMCLLRQWGATDFNAGLIAAAAGNMPRAIKLLVQWGATRLDAALTVVAQHAAPTWGKRGTKITMHMLKTLGATRISDAAVFAAEGSDDPNVLCTLAELGTVDYNAVLLRAATRGHRHMAEQACRCGATDITGAITAATDNGHGLLAAMLTVYAAKNANLRRGPDGDLSWEPSCDDLS